MASGCITDFKTAFIQYYFLVGSISVSCSYFGIISGSKKGRDLEQEVSSKYAKLLGGRNSVLFRMFEQNAQSEYHTTESTIFITYFIPIS